MPLRCTPERQRLCASHRQRRWLLWVCPPCGLECRACARLTARGGGWVDRSPRRRTWSHKRRARSGGVSHPCERLTSRLKSLPPRLPQSPFPRPAPRVVPVARRSPRRRGGRAVIPCALPRRVLSARRHPARCFGGLQRAIIHHDRGAFRPQLLERLRHPSTPGQLARGGRPGAQTSCTSHPRLLDILAPAVRRPRQPRHPLPPQRRLPRQRRPTAAGLPPAPGETSGAGAKDLPVEFLLHPPGTRRSLSHCSRLSHEVPADAAIA
jgi:hypothetical protein